MKLRKLQIVEQPVRVIQIILIKDRIIVEVEDVEDLHSIINMELIFDFVSVLLSINSKQFVHSR